MMCEYCKVCMNGNTRIICSVNTGNNFIGSNAKVSVVNKHNVPFDVPFSHIQDQ